MISSVCQGLQSDVESRVLSLQLFPQEPSYSSRLSLDVHRKGEEVEENSTIGKGIGRNRDEDYSGRRGGNGENGEGWSLLEALSKGNGIIHEKEKEEKVYVHPLVKLSKKSLEMCTESLGSESGSDMGENDISLLSSEGDDDHDSGPNNVRCWTWLPKKANRRQKATTFPPPLTSISSGCSSTGMRVESYREDGRLVLRAVAATSASRTSYFHAERSQGRLKLHLVRDMENRAQEVDEQAAVEVFGDQDQVFSAEVEEEAYWGNEKSREENNHDGHEMGIQNFGRPCSCSCKEGRRDPKELLNWEPLWVST